MLRAGISNLLADLRARISAHLQLYKPKGSAQSDVHTEVNPTLIICTVEVGGFPSSKRGVH